jgi:hypothetical protein
VHKENAKGKKKKNPKNGSSSLGILVLKNRSGIHMYNVEEIG